MLKQPASFVLDSLKSSTYPREYASGFNSPAALLDSLFKHPAEAFSPCSRHTIKALPCQKGFPVTCQIDYGWRDE
jgi:hypothetical protein